MLGKYSLVLSIFNLLLGGRNVSEIEKNLSKRRGSNKDVGKVICLELDLSSLTSVRRFAEAFKALRLPLHVLVNNGKFCDVVAKTKKKNEFTVLVWSPDFHQRVSYCLFYEDGYISFFYF